MKTFAAVAAAVLAMAGLSSTAAAGPSAHFVGRAATHAAHSADGTLYSNQGTDTGNAILSQNFEASMAAYSAGAADEFILSRSACITSIDVVGQYFNGSGPADSVDVTVYKNTNGKPGSVVSTATGLPYGNGASFYVKMPPPKPPLKGYREGAYWLSVVANMAYMAGGEWGWEVQSEISAREANWENPGGGFGICPSWDTITNCLGVTGDFMFSVNGYFGNCRGSNVLYNQSGNDSGFGTISQNFETSLDAFDAKAVDDFFAPAGGAHLKAVKVFGKYHNGAGPARDETVTLYLDNGGKPGTVKKQFTVSGVENGTGSIYMPVPQPYPPLIGGNRYWLAVQANLDLLSGGEWAWDNQTIEENLPAMWRNPGDGFATGCIAFTPENQCFVQPRGDHRFILYGTFDSARDLAEP